MPKLTLSSFNIQISLQAGEVPDSNPTMTVSGGLATINFSITSIILPPQVEFKISQLAISGLKVNRLDMYGEVSRQN